MASHETPTSPKIDTLTPLGRRVLNEIKAKDAETVGPGWNNGVVELCNPVERGWRLLQGVVELSDGDLPEAA